ncbi:MAG: efflux RND transporter periplasmic adaptor subunit [Bacteroidia bacterium]
MNMKEKSDKYIFVGFLLMVIIASACRDRNEEHEFIQEPVNIEVQAVSPNEQVLSRQATVKLQAGSKNAVIEAQGYIVPDATRNLAVAARISGRIEKLYIKFNGQSVKKGDKIMDLYSPDLLTFQEEHLFLIRSNGDNPLIENSRKKLLLLGMLENQIRQLENKGTVALAISVYSPTNGFVFFDTQISSENVNTDKPTEGNSMNMQGNQGNRGSFDPDISQIREGTYVNEGQTLFSVNDLNEVWALVSFSEQYIDQVSVKQSIQIVAEYNPSEKLIGKIILIEPAFEEANQRFVRVRITLSNPDNSLKMNTLISTQFTINKTGQLHVPSSAVYKTGLNAYVWVKTDTTEMGTGIFQLRRVIPGSNQNGSTYIVSGLEGNEEIAKEAGLMIDSETFLNIK